MSDLDLSLQITYNVKSYHFRDTESTHETIFGYKFTYSSKPRCATTTYIILDTPFSEAVGHWTYECAILIPQLRELAKIYDNIKIVYNPTPSYKDAFMAYVGIDRKHIYVPKIQNLGNNKSHNEYTLEDEGNICIYPNIRVCSVNLTMGTNIYTKLLHQLYTSFDFVGEKEFRITLLPRHTKQNYWTGDRTINTTDIASHLNEQDLVVDTSKCRNLAEQISFVRRSKFIVVNDGSAFLVNGLFARDSILIVLCGPFTTFSQATRIAPKLRQVIDHIRKTNQIIYVIAPVEDRKKYEFTYEHVQNIIENGMATLKLGNNMYISTSYDIDNIVGLRGVISEWKE